MPLMITAITRPPSTASRGLPLPPNRLVPPMTAAPTAYSRVSAPPVVGEIELSRLARRMPPTAARRRADDEAEQLDLLDVDAGPAGGLGVAADRVHVPAERGPAEQEGEPDQQHQQQHDDLGHALDRGHQRVAAALGGQVRGDRAEQHGEHHDLGDHHRDALGLQAAGPPGGGPAQRDQRVHRHDDRRTAPSRARPAACCC